MTLTALGHRLWHRRWRVDARPTNRLRDTFLVLQIIASRFPSNKADTAGTRRSGRGAVPISRREESGIIHMLKSKPEQIKRFRQIEINSFEDKPGVLDNFCQTHIAPPTDHSWKPTPLRRIKLLKNLILDLCFNFLADVAQGFVFLETHSTDRPLHGSMIFRVVGHL